MSDVPHAKLLEIMTSLCREAATISLASVGTAAVSRKPDRSVVTDTDFTIQDLILKAVAAEFPDHAVVAEERRSDGSSFPAATEARYCWIVDPLDGTRNYTAGFPCFSTSIAVLDRGRPVVAVVGEHNLGTIYAAVEGQGATLDGVPLRVRDAGQDEDCLVGIPSSKDRLTVGILGLWITTRGLILRNLGSSALHLAFVASGALSGAFAKRAKIWDVAAGALLVTEAGGVITSPQGASLTPFALDANPDEDVPFLAAAPNVHARLIDSIRETTTPAT